MTRERISLQAQAPFRLDLTAWALRRRERNVIDRWDGEKYERVVVVQNRPVRLAVTQRVNIATPTLDATVESARTLDRRGMKEVEHLARKMLGLATDLDPFYELAGKQEFLKTLAERFSGVKPPRFPSLFEALVNAVACQQVTLDLGILLLNRLSERFGSRVVDQGTSVYAFPMPSDLTEATEESIKDLGFSHQKARAIKELATQVADDSLDLEALHDATNDQAVEYLTSIRGIGRWSAEYVLLRGLGRMDVFPGDDIGAQNNLRRLFQLDDKPNYEQIRRLTSAWHPYEGVVYFHLLLEKLHATGAIA